MHAGSTGPWKELKRGSGSAVAWAASAQTFAVLHTIKARSRPAPLK